MNQGEKFFKFSNRLIVFGIPLVVASPFVFVFLEIVGVLGTRHLSAVDYQYGIGTFNSGNIEQGNPLGVAMKRISQKADDYESTGSVSVSWVESGPTSEKKCLRFLYFGQERVTGALSYCALKSNNWQCEEVALVTREELHQLSAGIGGYSATTKALERFKAKKLADFNGR